ncbi:MAG: SlyX family protein [Sphaerochaetaceae bacterium]
MEEDKTTELEIKLSYLEDIVEKLNKIVTKQELAMVTMKNKIQDLSEKIEDFDMENRPDRRPPHY